MSVSIVLLAVLYLIAVVKFALLHWEFESVPLIVSSRFIEEFERVRRAHRLGPPKQCLTLLSLHTELLTAFQILIVQRPTVLIQEQETRMTVSMMVTE